MYHSSSLCKYYLEDDFNKALTSNTNDSFSLCHLNVRSLQQNFTSMQAFMASLNIKFTILGITETWLNDNNCNLFNIPNYKFIETHRTTRSGGGVGLYLPENLRYKDRLDLNAFNETLECMFIEICADFLDISKNIIIGIIYRPPGADLKQFNDVFNDVLSNIKAERKVCYLMGDWNVNLLNYDCHVHTTNAIDMFYSYGFMPLINRPTRITNSSATIIDNIFTNNHSDLVNSFHGILICDISDHFPIFHINKSIKNVAQELHIVKRSFTAQNREAFLSQLSGTNWTSLLHIRNAQEAFTSFHQNFCHLFDINFPKRKF